MEIESFNAINEQMYFNVITVTLLIMTLLAVAGLVFYFAGTIWFWFTEARRGKRTAVPRSEHTRPACHSAINASRRVQVMD